METKKISIEEAEKRFAAAPIRRQGHWKTLCGEVKKTNQPVEVSGVTRGQIWGLKRTAKELGCRVVASDKDTKATILPPAKPK